MANCVPNKASWPLPANEIKPGAVIDLIRCSPNSRVVQPCRKSWRYSGSGLRLPRSTSSQLEDQAQALGWKAIAGYRKNHNASALRRHWEGNAGAAMNPYGIPRPLLVPDPALNNVRLVQRDAPCIGRTLAANRSKRRASLLRLEISKDNPPRRPRPKVHCLEIRFDLSGIKDQTPVPS